MAISIEHWETAVGGFVLAFGEIETIATSALKTLPTMPIGQTAAKLPLSTRLEMLDEMLSKSDDAACKAFCQRLRAVERYVQKRNLVAHNGLVFVVRRHTDGRIEIRSKIESRRTNKSVAVSFEEMRDATEEIKKLTLELGMAYADVLRSQAARPAE